MNTFQKMEFLKMVVNRSFTVVLSWTLWSSATNCQVMISPTEDYYDYGYTVYDHEAHDAYVLASGFSGVGDVYRDEAFPDPKIRVAKWMDSDEDVIVGCFHDLHQQGHFRLAVDTGTNITLIDSGVTMWAGTLFNVSVTPPVTFTCMLSTLIKSENYTLSKHGLKPQTPSVSLSYKLFAGFTGVVFIAMTLVVIVVTLKGKRTGPDKTTETNIYEETIMV